jgi:hypothetical protein
MIAGQIEIQLLANVARLQQDMDKANRTVSGAMGSISKAVSGAQTLLLGLGVGVSFAALIGQVNKAVDTLAKLDDMAQKTGSSVQNLSRLQKVASQFGQDFNTIDAAVSKLARNLAGIDDAGGKTAKALNSIGISQQFVKSNDPSQVMVEVAKQLQNYQDGASKAALATDLFGKAGVELLPYLNDLAENVDKYQGATAEAAAQSAKFQDMLGGLRVEFGNLVETVTIGMLPTLTAFIDKLNQILQFKSIFSSVGGIQAKDYDKEIATRVKSLNEVTRLKDALSKPTLANKINDVVFGDVRDLTVQQGIYQDEIKALQNLKKAQDALKASPYVAPNSDKKVLGYVGEEAQKALEADAKAAKAIRDKASEEKLKDLQKEIDFEQDIKETVYKTEIENEKKQDAARQKLQESFFEMDKKYLDILDKLESKAIDERAKKQIKAAEELAKKQEQVARDFNRSLTDALLRGFESGKDFAQNFKDTLINMFQTLILRPTIEAVLNGSGITKAATGIVGGITSVFGGNAMAGNGVATAGILDQSKSVFDVITKGFDSANASLNATVTNFGGFVRGMGASGGIFDTLGASIQLNNAMISSALPYAGAALALLQGDTKGALFQGGGAALGGLVGGPVGGAIGAALGSVVGGMFGGKKQPPRTVTQLPQVSEQFNAQLSTLLGGFGLANNVSSNTSYKGRGGGSGYGTFQSNINGVDSTLYTKDSGAYSQASMDAFVNRVLTTELVNAIKRSDISAGIKTLFDGLADQTQISNMIQATIALNNGNAQLIERFNLTADAAANLAKSSGLAGEELVNLVASLAQAAGAFSTPAQQLIKFRDTLTSDLGRALPATLDAFDAILKSFDTTTSAGRDLFLSMFNLRDEFAQFTGSLDAIKKGVSDSVFGLLSPAQQQAMNKARLSEEFAKFNIAVPQSVQQLIAIGQGLDFTTEAGLNLALAFPTLVQAFQATQGAVDALANSLNPERFRTFFDFAVASSYSRQGLSIPAANMPSYAVGTSYVPNDGVAMLHQGEAVLTKSQNTDMSMNSGKVVSLLEALVNRVGELEYDLRRAADGSQRTARELEDLTSGDSTITTQAA